MPELLKIEDPIELRNYLVWVAVGPGDGKSQLLDDTPPHGFFMPNKVCVVVRQTGDHVWAHWTQAREEYEGPGWSRCSGTCEFKDYTKPAWVSVVEEFAVNAVKEVRRPPLKRNDPASRSW